ncbi:saccharopine dehydrogenase NADP-binding domain-containing protein [Horticoccus luteus]|uniref:Saccharopine dehydrogenase NADP-binding domain-containing protein n=1 Tax=Horticoccus luteus TaxID=2862869 RepID=A0A8F9TTK4_9BACT|nr:saccharopine dehydrogenase NADP-binding domain-containing protein [Horticoccus luteus]QYM78043.1 saccharopine dehydrogenase NADP-binding domain-containing protein [Horticoccus luteus]
MKIGIIGAGKVGATIATLLESCRFCRAVVLGDARSDVEVSGLKKARTVTLNVKEAAELAALVKKCDAVVSAAPYFLNKTIAQACAERGVSYFDLTEDVHTTNFVRALAKDAKATFMPQCGLAPGAINIVGGDLASSLDNVRQCEMRVGALPLFASNQMKYYLSWSTAGLINEYCQLGEALHGGKRITTLPLDGVERLTVDGVEYEAFNTSGGVATMCETFEGKVGELNYKTMRYPGHRDLMRFMLQDLNLADRQELLTQIFDQEVPLTDHDVVVFYVSVVGTVKGRLVQRSFVKKMRGAVVQRRTLSAIQLTTAAGVVAILELFAGGKLGAGFVKQESVPLKAFLATKWGGRVYGA